MQPRVRLGPSGGSRERNGSSSALCGGLGLEKTTLTRQLCTKPADPVTHTVCPQWKNTVVEKGGKNDVALPPKLLLLLRINELFKLSVGVYRLSSPANHKGLQPFQHPS